MGSNQHTSDQFPALSTERLRLRPFNQDDASRIRFLAGDADVARMTRTIPHPYPQGAAELWLDHTSGLIAQGLLRQYAIARNDDGLLIGCLTLRKRSPAENEAELAYWLGKSFWGRGYIAEAARAALCDASANFGLTSARAATLPINQRSIRVLEKLGFVPGGTIEARGPGWVGRVELSRYVLNFGD